MIILSQQFSRRKSGLIVPLFNRPNIADNSAYLPNTPIWGYSGDGASGNINTRFHRRLSGFQANANGGNCGVILSDRQQALGGGQTWEVWMNLLNTGPYRAEIEPREEAWQPNYRILTNIAVPIDYTVHTCATVSRPIGHVPGTVNAPSTLQEDGPQNLLMQVHPHDDNVAGDGDQALDVTPWTAISMDNNGLTAYQKGSNGTFATPVWPRTTLISDINTPFGLGWRLRILYRARFTKSSSGFETIDTQWIDPVNKILYPWVNRLTYLGATMHPDNVNKNPYMRWGNYAFDNLVYGDQMRDSGAGILRFGARRYELYYEDFVWGDESNDPRYAGMTIGDIQARNSYSLVA